LATATITGIGLPAFRGTDSRESPALSEQSRRILRLQQLCGSSSRLRRWQRTLQPLQATGQSRNLTYKLARGHLTAPPTPQRSPVDMIMLRKLFAYAPPAKTLPVMLLFLIPGSSAIAADPGIPPATAQATEESLAGHAGGLRVFTDPVSGEFRAPQPAEKTSQGPSVGSKRKPSATRLVERSHPNKAIRGVVEVPRDLYPLLTEKSVRGDVEVGCD